jgi:cellulose 1,4-beta-cellobiosidase
MTSSAKWQRFTGAFGALAAGLLAGLAFPAQAQTHVDNPFVGASMYVNPDFTARADATAAVATDPQLAGPMRLVGRYPTAVWLERVDAVPGLTAHLDRVVAAGNGLALFVLHDMPGRGCDAPVLDGELPLTSDGLRTYESQFIDAIAAIAGQAKYAGVRIVFVVEPGSLANLVTNLSVPSCAQAQSSGIHVAAVQYAVNKLHAIPNVYLYLDIAHAGRLGWDDNTAGMVALLGSVSTGFTAGKSALDGFSTNVSDFVPVKEPYLTATTTLNGQQVRSASFYQYNSDIDDASFAAHLWNRLTAASWPTTIGMLADTSRNGWGGGRRPTGPSPVSDDLERFVNESRVDRRTTRSAWCNPSGAGIGQPPQAAPAGFAASHYDAFVWVKTPGLSDGSALLDRWCDPSSLTPEGVLTGALPDAPEAGQWFPAQFTQLVQNMWPMSSQPVHFPLTVEPSGYGTVTSTPAGIDCGPTCSGSFLAPTQVTLTAAPLTEGIPFVAWTGACAGTTTPTCVVSMTQAQTVGTYWGSLYTLTVSRAGAGAGAVRSTPGGIDCGTSCSASYGLYTAVTLTATASAGSSFAGWSGACVGAQATCTVAMTAAREVNATFQPGTWYPLGVTVSESGICNPPPGCLPGNACIAVCYGGNAVTSSPPGISCGNGGACSAAYASGTSVVLTATPYNAQNLFAGWVGACSGSTARTCTVPVTQAQSVTARFLGSNNYMLRVSTAGSGKVTGWAGAIDCGTVCNVPFTAGTTVALTATAAVGSTFTGWSGGGCSGTAPTCTVAMTSDQYVSATFSTPVTFPLTVTKPGLGTGTVVSTPAGIQCGATCTASFPGGSSVTLTAVAASGSVFAAWGGACGGTASTCVVPMTQAQSVAASFGGPNPIFTVAKSGTGAGTVVSTPAGITCGTVCSASISGRTVTLTATAAAGSSFTGWSGGCTGTAATCVITADPLTQRASAVATFTLAPTPCTNPIAFSWNTGNFNTTNAVCYRTSQKVNGWGCSNFAGRTVRVNGGTATATCGAGPFPLAKASDGSTYFVVSAGQSPWASLYVW